MSTPGMPVLTDVITIYTDGGCYNVASTEARGVGAWAYVRMGDKEPIIVAERNLDTTNNRMELLAIINAINDLPEHSKILIVTDSGYVINGITSYIDRWMHNGWKTVSGKDVLNRDLWIQLNALTYHYSIAWEHIRGHRKCPIPERSYWNSIADSACTWAMHHADDELPHYMTCEKMKGCKQ